MVRYVEEFVSQLGRRHVRKGYSMAIPKGKGWKKSVREEQQRRSREIVVSFSLPDPPKSAPTDAKATDETAKNEKNSDRPPITFRF